MVSSVLFVCTGNTCRSVMAEYLLKDALKKADLNMEVGSAGLAAFTGDSAAANALAVLGEVGIDGSGHRSRRVQPLLLEEYDLILAMTNGHKQELLRLMPELSSRIFLLKEFIERNELLGQEAALEIEKSYEISDPFGQSLMVYRKSRDEIAQAVKALVDLWSLEERR